MEPTRFVHSVKVPRFYKSAASVIRRVKEEGRSPKNLIFNSGRSFNFKRLYGLILKALTNYETLDILLNKSQLLKKEERLDPWLARILISEILWGKKRLPGNSKPITTICNYHEKFLKILKDVPEPENEAIQKRIFVRVNTLKITVKEVINEFTNEGWNLLPTPEKYDDFMNEIMELEAGSFMQDWHISEILVFPPKSMIHDHVLHTSGSIVIHDKASCLVVPALAPPPGSVVLDMCAAPGMKTAHCAAMMKNKGKIYAVEKNKARYKVLEETVKKLNCSCVETFHEDALKLDVKKFEDVEYIIIDAPCSGSGMVGRYDYGVKTTDKKRLERLRGLQCLLLKSAMKNFPSVKRIIYSTCSSHEEENEGVIEDVLASVASEEFELVKCSALEKRNIHFGNDNYNFSNKCYRLDLKAHQTNDFFIAMFKRKEDNDAEKENGICDSREIKNRKRTKEMRTKKKLNQLNKDAESTLDSAENEDDNTSAMKSMVEKKKKKKHSSFNEGSELEMKDVEDSSIITDKNSHNADKVKKKKLKANKMKL